MPPKTININIQVESTGHRNSRLWFLAKNNWIYGLYACSFQHSQPEKWSLAYPYEA